MIGLSKYHKLFAVGLAVRLAIAPFFAHPFDVYAWYTNAESFLGGVTPVWNYLVPYGYAFFLFVFPAGLAFNALSGLVGSHVIPISSLNPILNPGASWNITVVPGPLFDLLVKLPLIASDAVVALIIYRLVLRNLGDEGLASLASIGWFLNPLVIWVSSGWGMFDTLPALFTVLALYFVMGGRFAYSGLSLAGAIAMKYYAVVLLIPMLVIAWREGGKRGALVAAGAAAGACAVLFTPVLGQVVSGYAGLVSSSPQQGLVYSGLSFWSAITLFTPFPALTVASAFLIAGALGIAYVWMVRTGKKGMLSYATFFGIPVLFLLIFFRFVGENYFVWVLPFASILALRSRTGRYLFWSVSVLALIANFADSLLPYYMLPMAPWIGGFLVNALSFAAPYRVAPSGSVVATLSAGKVFLGSLGVLSAVLLLLLARNWVAGPLPSGPPDESAPSVSPSRIYSKMRGLV